MGNIEKPVTVLTEAECWEKLASHHVGRIVTNVGEVIDVVPLNYVVDNGTIVFRTGEGSKLSQLTVNNSVILQVDDYTSETGWSVVLRGTARRLETSEEVFAADQLSLKPMVATLKFNYVRIKAQSLTGRTFNFGPEPNREAVQKG